MTYWWEKIRKPESSVATLPQPQEQVYEEVYEEPWEKPQEDEITPYLMDLGEDIFTAETSTGRKLTASMNEVLGVDVSPYKGQYGAIAEQAKIKEYFLKQLQKGEELKDYQRTRKVTGQTIDVNKLVRSKGQAEATEVLKRAGVENAGELVLGITPDINILLSRLQKEGKEGYQVTSLYNDWRRELLMTLQQSGLYGAGLARYNVGDIQDPQLRTWWDEQERLSDRQDAEWKAKVDKARAEEFERLSKKYPARPSYDISRMISITRTAQKAVTSTYPKDHPVYQKTVWEAEQESKGRKPAEKKLPETKLSIFNVETTRGTVQVVATDERFVRNATIKEHRADFADVDKPVTKTGEITVKGDKTAFDTWRDRQEIKTEFKAGDVVYRTDEGWATVPAGIYKEMTTAPAFVFTLNTNKGPKKFIAVDEEQATREAESYGLKVTGVKSEEEITLTPKKIQGLLTVAQQRGGQHYTEALVKTGAISPSLSPHITKDGRLDTVGALQDPNVSEDDLLTAVSQEVIDEAKTQLASIEEVAEVENIFNEVFPGAGAGEVLTHIQDKPEDFLRDILEVGPTEDMVTLLKLLEFEDEHGNSHHLTDAEIQEIFDTKIPPKFTPESWLKDNFWDAFVLPITTLLGHGLGTWFSAIMPSVMETTAAKIKSLAYETMSIPAQIIEFLGLTIGGLPREEAAEEAGVTGREALKPITLTADQIISDFFPSIQEKAKERFLQRMEENDAWIAEHPELTPNPKYLENPFENPELFKDPGYWAYTISSTTAYSLSVMGTLIGVSAVATPAAGIPAAMMVAAGPEATSMTEELVKQGVPFEEAVQWGTLYGLTAGGIETVTDLPFIGLIFKPIGQAVKPMWNTIFRGVANRIARRIMTGLVIAQTEGFEEVITQAVHNAILQHYDDTVSITEGMSHGYIQGVIASTPFGAIGGYASFRTFYDKLSPQTQQQYDDLVARFQKAGLTLEQAQVQAANEIAKTTEGAAEISQAIDAAKEEYKGKAKVTPAVTGALNKVTSMWEGVAVDRVPFKERISNARLWFEENVTDKFAGINKMTRRATREYGAPLPVEVDAELQSSLLAGAPEAGRQRAVDAYRGMKHILGKGIDISYVDSYLALRHSLDVMKLKGEQRLGVGAIKGIKEVEAALAEMEATLGAEGFAKVVKAAEVIRDFYATTLQRKVESGLISKELADLLQAQYPWYNPIKYVEYVTARSEAGGKTLSVGRNDLRRLSEIGLGTARERPLNTLARTAVASEMLISRNDAAKAIIGTAKFDPQLADLIKKVTPAQAKGKPTISFMENGERVIYEVPEWLEREAKYLSTIPSTQLERMGRIMLAPSRFGMTTANLAFFIPNFAIDSLTAMITKGILPHDIAISLARNLKGIIREDRVMGEMLKGRGGMSGFWGKSPEAIAAEVAKKGQLVLSPKWDAKRILGAPFEAITSLGHAIEMTPRLAVYSKELKRGSPVERAALAARRATIDFNRGGVAIRQANAFYLYLNAGVQGSMIPFRALRDSVRARIWLAGYILGVVGIYAWNRQFPEYEDVPDFAKYGSLIVMLPSEEYDQYGNKVPHYILIVPNLREFALFSGPLIYALRQLDGKDPGGMNQFLSSWVPGINPVSQIAGSSGLLVPTPIGQTLIDMQQNWDSFRNRKIIPDDLLQEPASEQYNVYTSLTAKRLGGALNLSPLMLDYFIKNIFGGLGQQFLGLSDSILRKVAPEYVDPRIKGLVDQLTTLKDTYKGNDLAVARRDFLNNLSREDRDEVLKLERIPEPRIPILTAIKNRIYREWGGQIYDNFRREAQELIDNTEATKYADDKFYSTMEAIADAWFSGEITWEAASEQISDVRARHSGSLNDLWVARNAMGIITSADVQRLLPEEDIRPEEFRALDDYWQLEAELIEKAKGKLDNETWDNIFKELDYYVSTLTPELREYINEHKYDWVNKLDEKSQAMMHQYYQDIEEIADSGYWDLTSRAKNSFLNNSDNARIDALMVIRGWRDEASTPEATLLVGQLIKEYGLTADAVYGDDIDARLKEFDFGIPVSDVYSMIKSYDAMPTETEAQKEARAETLDSNPKMEAIFCFTGKQWAYPSTKEAWSELENLIELNNYTWETLYGKNAAPIIDKIQLYSTMEQVLEQKYPGEEKSVSRYKAALRFAFPEFDAFLVKEKGLTPIKDYEYYVTSIARWRTIIDEEGWLEGGKYWWENNL